MRTGIWKDVHSGVILGNDLWPCHLIILLGWSRPCLQGCPPSRPPGWSVTCSWTRSLARAHASWWRKSWRSASRPSGLTQFGGRYYEQLSGGPTGSRATLCASRIVMYHRSKETDQNNTELGVERMLDEVCILWGREAHQPVHQPQVGPTH